MQPRYPIFVLYRDCGEIHAFSSAAEMQKQFEKIDVEDHEYEAWDANGDHLLLYVAKNEHEWLRVETARHDDRKGLTDAIRRFAQLRRAQVDESKMARGEFSTVVDEVWSAVRLPEHGDGPKSRI